jgi:xylulokinase
VVEAVLALDIGTTAIKAALVAADGAILAIERAPTPSSSPQVGWLEHDPELLWAASSSVLGRVAAAAAAAGVQPRALAVTGARGTVCLIDADGRALTPFLTWQDRRSIEVLPGLRERLGGELAYYKRTGVRLDPSIMGPKLVWLRQHARDRFERARWAATTQGFAARRLTAEPPSTDFSTANFFGLMDIDADGWSAELVERFELPAELLPPLAAPGASAGTVAADVAAALGLPAGIPVVLAGSDGVCAELGAGVLDPGQLYGYLGTAGALASPLLEPRVDPQARLLVSQGSVSGRWRVLALSFAGASATDWWRTVAAIDQPGKLDRALAATTPGARGVLFMPTLSGAGTPHWSARARGAFLGLSLSHSADELSRAVCEGIAIELRLMLGALSAFGVVPSELRLTGGGARSDQWVALLANVLELAIERIDHPEPGLLGNASYALAAIGVYSDPLTATRALRAPAQLFEPDSALAGRYGELAAAYELARDTFEHSGLDDRLASLGADA